MRKEPKIPVKINKDWMPTKINGKWGYVDKHGLGKTTVKPEFDYCSSLFVDGKAPVKKDGKWGVINLKGEFLISPMFDDYSFYDNGNFYFRIKNMHYIKLSTKNLVLRYGV